jgi:hypothetical protein
MAKMDVLAALAVLTENGLVLDDESNKAIAALTEKAFKGEALAVLSGDENHTGKLIGEKGMKSAETWVSEMFALSATVRNEMIGEIKKVQGGAQRMVRVFGFDTPDGYLKVELRSSIED